MPKRTKKSPREPVQTPPRTEVPPGATRKAFDRALDPGGGPPGSAAGPRHAADDTGSESETFGRSDSTLSAASAPVEEEDWLEMGPPYAGRSGGAVGGTPAQLRSSEGTPRRDSDSVQAAAAPAPSSQERIPTQVKPGGEIIRLTGFEAIEYAEKQGLTLNKHPDPIMGPRVGLNVGDAEAIADEDPDLIWLDVATEDYYSGPPSNYEPER